MRRWIPWQVLTYQFAITLVIFIVWLDKGKKSPSIQVSDTSDTSNGSDDSDSSSSNDEEKKAEQAQKKAEKQAKKEAEKKKVKKEKKKNEKQMQFEALWAAGKKHIEAPNSRDPSENGK